MASFSRILVVLLFVVLAAGAYIASARGIGMKGIHNQQTVDQIRTNCPDYYRTQNGDCLGRTFRGFFLVRGVRGGGFGGGGK